MGSRNCGYINTLVIYVYDNGNGEEGKIYAIVAAYLIIASTCSDRWKSVLHTVIYNILKVTFYVVQKPIFDLSWLIESGPSTFRTEYSNFCLNYHPWVVPIGGSGKRHYPFCTIPENLTFSMLYVYNSVKHTVTPIRVRSYCYWIYSSNSKNILFFSILIVIVYYYTGIYIPKIPLDRHWN